MSNPVAKSLPVTALNPFVDLGNSPAALDATQFLAELAARRISVGEYVQACFDRIERFNPALHAFKLHDREAGLRRAGLLDQEIARGAEIRAMSGVPVGVKDIFNTYDYATGMGSTILEHYMPGNDARVVSNLRLEGGLVAGKTVTAEFAVHTPGPTLNPHDTTRTPGTSSSGSAVAVACGMVPVALATQTAGSIIRPASYCGVMGFKPSFGLIPRTAMLKTTDTLDTVGFMARSVDDLRRMFEVTRVRGHNYPSSERALADPARATPANRPWRVGVVRGPMSHEERPAVTERLTQVVRRLVAVGCEVFDYDLPQDLHEVHDLHETIYRRALAYYFRYEWKSHSDKFSPRLQAMIEGGLRIQPEDYQRAVQRQSEIIRSFDAVASTQFDILIGPSTADEAPVGLEADDLPDHCLIWTFVGAPVISMPLLAGSTGLPVGLQVLSRRYADYKLLDFCKFVQDAMIV